MAGKRGSLRVSLLLLLASPAPAPVGAAGEPAAVRYTDQGALVIPGDYREWVYMSSGLDMSYVAKTSIENHSMFDNVFVKPDAWALFKQSGHWPDKTIFAMENRVAAIQGSINKRGQFQTGELMGLEFHVRDDARFKGGWAFFVSEGGDTAAMIPVEADCYSCHRAHGAVDTTFTQFYPTAKPIAQKAGNYRDE